MAAHTVLGNVANTPTPTIETACHHFQRSIELAEALGLPDEVITGKLNLGDVALSSGDAKAAERLFAEGLDHRRRSGSVERIGLALLNLGQAQLRLGESKAARASFIEAYDLFSRVGFRARMAHALQALAAVDATEGNPEEAARQLGRARAELADLGWSDDDSTLPLEVEARLRRTLGDHAFDAGIRERRGRTHSHVRRTPSHTAFRPRACRRVTGRGAGLTRQAPRGHCRTLGQANRLSGVLA